MLKLKKLGTKSYFNVNHISFVFIYLVYSSVFVFLNSYFPILFFDVLNINRIILAFIQFLAYSVILLRPVFASITDRYKLNGYQRKYYIIFSGYILALIYMLMGLTYQNMIIFGVLLLLVFLSGTMLDVSTKSLILDISPTDDVKKKAFFFVLCGDALGRFFPFLLYSTLISDVYSITSWMTFFIFSYMFLFPLLVFLPFINENGRSKSNSQIAHPVCTNLIESENEILYKNLKTVYILLCIFTFFAFSDAIFTYPFFPWLLGKFGINNFKIFNLFLIFYFLLSIMSSGIAAFLIKRIKSKKLIFVLMPIVGLAYILYTIVPFTIFVFLYFIGSSFAIIINFNISILVMNFKKGNKSLYFHVIATFKNLSLFFFIPLGTMLSSFFMTEILIILGAFLLNLSIIPLIYIKY
ncbi:MAG: hypothetical protein ACFFA3_14805 [Promethearchaeota archaeon]